MGSQGQESRPVRASYDVVIVGGAIMGSSLAWFLTRETGFKGSILVVERDPTYSRSSTALSNSCIRQQFSTELNVRISQFTAEFIRNLREFMGGDERIPRLSIQNFGYLYLAGSPQAAEVLRANQKVQRAAGAQTRLLEPAEIAAEYPFYDLEGMLLGSINTKDEGYWDGGTVFDWLRRSARAGGAEYIANEVVAMGSAAAGDRISSVTLATGETIACGVVVNASGPRAGLTAAMAGIHLPVEPRKRYTWVFTAERPLERELPLTIDPSGVHVRQDGPQTYMAGSKGDPDEAAGFDDFSFEHALWEDHVWPILATRIPRFEAIRVVNQWTGHYDYNTLDQNAVLGPHGRISNFHFINGFSGHGLQQAPAMGRGLAELIVHGGFRTLDLSPFAYGRIERGEPIVEAAII